MFPLGWASWTAMTLQVTMEIKMMWEALPLVDTHSKLEDPFATGCSARFSPPTSEVMWRQARILHSELMGKITEKTVVVCFKPFQNDWNHRLIGTTTKTKLPRYVGSKSNNCMFTRATSSEQMIGSGVGILKFHGLWNNPWAVSSLVYKYNIYIYIQKIQTTRAAGQVDTFWICSEDSTDWKPLYITPQSKLVPTTKWLLPPLRKQKHGTFKNIPFF